MRGLGGGEGNYGPEARLRGRVAVPYLPRLMGAAGLRGAGLAGAAGLLGAPGLPAVVLEMLFFM